MATEKGEQMTYWIVNGSLIVLISIGLIILWSLRWREERREQRNAAWLYHRIHEDYGEKEAHEYAARVEFRGIDIPKKRNTNGN